MNKEINTTAVGEEAVAVRPDYESEIISVIRGNYSPKAAQKKLEDYHGNDIAQAMDSLTVQERKKLYRFCSASMLAEAMEHLEEDEAADDVPGADKDKEQGTADEIPSAGEDKPQGTADDLSAQSEDKMPEKAGSEDNTEHNTEE